MLLKHSSPKFLQPLPAPNLPPHSSSSGQSLKRARMGMCAVFNFLNFPTAKALRKLVSKTKERTQDFQSAPAAAAAPSQPPAHSAVQSGRGQLTTVAPLTSVTQITPLESKVPLYEKAAQPQTAMS